MEKKNGSDILGAHMKLRRLAVLTDKGERWWKGKIKDGSVRGYILGGEYIVEVDSVNELMERCRVGKVEAAK